MELEVSIAQLHHPAQAEHNKSFHTALLAVWKDLFLLQDSAPGYGR